MLSKKQLKEKRMDEMGRVNDIVNPAVESLSGMAVRLHEEGYHQWSAAVGNLASIIDKAHHRFYDQIDPGE